jgi:hypothetical protein
VSSLGSCRCCFAACLRRAAGLPQFIGEVALAADGQDAPNRLSGGIRRRGSVAATCERRVVHVGARRRSLHRRRRTEHLLSVPHGEYYQLTAERFFLRLLQLHIP